MRLPVHSTTSTASDWVYSACLWAIILSLFLQSLPLMRKRRQVTTRTGPFFVPAVVAMAVAFLNADNERINLPCTVLAVAFILLNDWIPIVVGRKP